MVNKVGALQSLVHKSSYLDQEAGNRQCKATGVELQKDFRTVYLACTALACDVVANFLAPVQVLYQTLLQLCTTISSVVEDIQSPAQQSGIGQKKSNKLGECLPGSPFNHVHGSLLLFRAKDCSAFLILISFSFVLLKCQA
jgi:hypothetical protein